MKTIYKTLFIIALCTAFVAVGIAALLGRELHYANERSANQHQTITEYMEREWAVE